MTLVLEQAKKERYLRGREMKKNKAVQVKPHQSTCSAYTVPCVALLEQAAPTTYCPLLSLLASAGQAAPRECRLPARLRLRRGALPTGRRLPRGRLGPGKASTDLVEKGLLSWPTLVDYLRRLNDRLTSHTYRVEPTAGRTASQSNY